MGITFQQTDAASACAPMSACAPAKTIVTPIVDVAMAPGGTPGTTAETFDIAASASEYKTFFQSDDVGQTDWPAGNWTVNLNISSAQNNMAWTGVWICRVDTTCGTIASVGSETASVDVSAGGIFSKTVTGAATTGATTDAVYVVCQFANSHTMTARTIGVTPSETVASPIEIVTVETGSAASVTDTSATLNGTLSALDGTTSADVWFEWRPVGGTTWNTTPAQTLTAPGSFSAGITGLTETTDYEFRAQATTANASSTGLTATFTTATVIAGTVTIGGTAVAGATVHIIDSSTDTVVATVTTAADGTFSHTATGGPFHVAVQHDDGTTKYNAPSYHSIQ